MDNFENLLITFQDPDLEVSISIGHHKMANTADHNHHLARIRAPTSIEARSGKTFIEPLIIRILVDVSQRNRNALGIIFALSSMAILLIQSPLSSASSPNDVVTIVKTDKLIYEPGEDFNITIVLMNPTNSSISLASGGSPPWFISIYDGSGNQVYGYGGLQTMNAYYSIGPNESVTYRHTMTKYLNPGFYLINGSGYDAPHDQILIQVNGTNEQNTNISPGYDLSTLGIAFFFGVAIGMTVLFLIVRKRMKRI